MKESGTLRIGMIPLNWEMRRFKHIAQLYTGNSIRDEEKELYEDPLDAVPYIASKDIDTIFQTANYENGMYVKTADTAFKFAEAGSTLMCIEGGSAGRKKTHLSQRVAFVNKLCCFSPSGIDGGFLFYWVCSPNFEDEFRQHITGLIGGVSISVIQNFCILVPPLSNQVRITAFLNRRCAEIDNIIATTQRTIEEYRRLKQSIIAEAVTHGVRGPRKMKDSGVEWIGEIPEEWKTVRVKYLLNERNERSVNGEEEPLSMSQKYGLIPTRNMDTVPNMASSFIGAKLAYENDLVFNKLKAHLGVFSVSHYDGLVSPDYAVYYSTGKADLKYLEYVFKTPQCIIEFRKKSTGIAAGLTRLYTDGLFSIVLPYPSLEEQQEIVLRLSCQCTEIDRLIDSKQQLLTELEAYKKSVIYEYVTGKREVPQ